jgi:hypothetical protein
MSSGRRPPSTLEKKYHHTQKVASRKSMIPTTPCQRVKVSPDKTPDMPKKYSKPLPRSTETGIHPRLKRRSSDQSLRLRPKDMKILQTTPNSRSSGTSGCMVMPERRSTK